MHLFSRSHPGAKKLRDVRMCIVHKALVRSRQPAGNAKHPAPVETVRAILSHVRAPKLECHHGKAACQQNGKADEDLSGVDAHSQGFAVACIRCFPRLRFSSSCKVRALDSGE